MIKCPFCGKDFDEKAQPKVKWYFTTYWVVIAFLGVGPLALPLIWYNPRYKPMTKWIVSVVAIIVTIWLCIKSIDLYQSLMKQMGDLQNSGF